MKTISVLMSLSLLLVSGSVLAQGQAEGPCKQIVDACKSAGFIKGDVKDGKGLWVDCVGPIMQGKAQPKKAVLPLPTVDSSVVSACHSKHPNFGEGHGHGGHAAGGAAPSGAAGG